MALVIGNPFGELKGRIGGTVFTKNKAGQIARVYRTPVSSRSQAQNIVRQSFQNVSKSWKNLIAPIGSYWQTFATSVYAPLKRTNHGQYSGYQAFVACQQAAANSNKWITPVSIVSDTSGGPLGLTQVPWSQFTNPEEVSIQPNLHDTNLPAKNITIANVTISQVGAVVLRLQWIPVGLTGLGGSIFIDANSLPMGFIVYISDPISNPGNTPKHQFKQIICSTGHMLITTPNLNTSHYADFTFSANPLLTNSKQFPSTGHYVLLSVVNISPLGTQSLIGSRVTVIS
jgi:hypothetical protein